MAQGDSLSPTLLLFFIADLAGEIRGVSNLQFLFYADDLALYGTDPSSINAGLEVLRKWCQRNKIEVNTEKTKVMKFRPAGRYSRNDVFMFGQTRLELVNSFDYLGVTLQPSLRFTNHILKRKSLALSAIGTMTKHLRLISVQNALRIFDHKIGPIVTYGLDSIAPFLTVKDLQEMDRVKSIFLKTVLCLPKSSCATLTYHLCETEPLVQELKGMGHFEFTREVLIAYQEFRREREEAFKEMEYHLGPAFLDDQWKKPHQKHRHIQTRLTAHGFHHVLCQNDDFHQPSEDCFCIFCEGPATNRYHVIHCPDFSVYRVDERAVFMDECYYAS